MKYAFFIFVLLSTLTQAAEDKPVDKNRKSVAEQNDKPQRCSILRDKNCYEQPSRATRALRRLK